MDAKLVDWGENFEFESDRLEVDFDNMIGVEFDFDIGVGPSFDMGKIGLGIDYESYY